MVDHVMLELVQLVCVLFGVLSFVPAYEVFGATLFAAVPGSAIPRLCLVLIV